MAAEVTAYIAVELGSLGVELMLNVLRMVLPNPDEEVIDNEPALVVLTGAIIVVGSKFNR